MPLAEETPLGLANRFKVTIDFPKPVDLGSWAKVDGLDVTFDVVEYRAGDAWNQRWYAPGATKYSTVKLSRAVSPDTKKVQGWLNDTALRYQPGNMIVVLLDAKNDKVMEWEMRAAMPSKWSVTGFDASASKLAYEQLDIVHLGFLADDAQ